MFNSMPTRHASRDALEHLASIDLLELCNEAKIERCRATRDLSSCGRYVQDVLNSCGHASLCAECSKRCDMCPICRTSLPVNGNRLRPRLYYKCTNAGLIPKSYADRFQEKDDSKDHILAIQRLYSLFDVALDNNLVCLICHYITDVCMDENAVSSDPVLSFLLDEVVVKDWCKQKFKGIIHDLQTTYMLDLEGMKSKLCSLQKLASQLTGISNILEVMVSSFKDNISAQLNNLHFLLNSTLKTKQEACALLPQIAGPDTHPKVAQVLLERKRSDVALTVLRCTGHDGFSGYDNFVDDEGKFVSLEEALTVLRVRTECGLLTEAFMCLRKYCHNLKESTAKQQNLLSSNSLKSDLNTHTEILVTEMCLICIRMHLVDRMIELPWDSTEEIYIHKCLLEDARQGPSISGSLLTVFYLQRYRYIEAFQVHRQLQSLEQGFLENLNGYDASQIKSISLWRSTLVESALDLLPEIERKRVMSESSAETDISFSQDDQMEVESASEAQLKPLSNISTSCSKPQSLVLRRL